MREGTAAFRLGCAVLLLAVASGCGGSTSTPGTTARVPSASVSHDPTGEPRRGLALVRANGYRIDQGFAGGDGSLLLEYASYAAPGCYYRRVARDGTVSGSFQSGQGCRDVRAHGSGYVGLPLDGGSGLPTLRDAADLTDPPHPVPVAADDPARVAGAGDVYLGWCSDLSEPETRDPGRRGCAYAPAGHTFYRLRPALTVDPAGRVWRAGRGHVLTVTYGATSWPDLALARPGWRRVTTPFPSAPVELIGSSGSSAAVWLEGGHHPLYLTTDVGGTWHRVRSLPDDARNPTSTVILPDGRLLLGPSNGVFWRATDGGNRTFETHEAGPIRTMLSRGDRVFGLSDGDDSRFFGYVWMSTDAGSTWRQVIGHEGATRAHRAVPADQLRVHRQPSVAPVVARYPPSDVVAAGNGLLLVIYGDAGASRRSAWRLYDRRNHVVEEGLDAWRVTTAGDGLLLETNDGTFAIGGTGAQTRVADRLMERRPVRSGDVFVSDRGVLRPGTSELFTGVARPNGTVTAMDGDGRMWALGRHTPGRTVLRWAFPGRPWHSRDLGPAIGARTVLARGPVLTVSGPHRLYVSGDAGRTWSLRVHGAGVYSGVPFFSIRPDGSIIGGDDRAGIRISDDLRTFRVPTAADEDALEIGDLFERLRGGRPEISLDRRNWQPFSVAAAHRLLAR